MPPDSLPPITVVHDDLEFFELLGEVLGESHRLNRVARAESITAIANSEPTLLMVGPFPTADAVSLSAWDVVALARADRDLRTVPIIVFTSDANLLSDDDTHLRADQDVLLVGIPFELDVLDHVVMSIDRRRDARPRVPDQVCSRGRLSELCPHGYEAMDCQH